MTTPHLSRRAAGAVAVLAATTLIAACGGQNPPDTATEESASVEGSSITIGTISQLKDQFQVYADAYMKEYPNRKVTIEGLTDDPAKYPQLLATRRISNSTPDLFFNVDFLADTLATNRVALDLAPGLAKKQDGLSEGEFLPQFLGQYRPANASKQVTGLPVSADSTALVYNKALFEKAGVSEYPTENWTWDDFYRVAAEIQSKSGGKITGAVSPLADGSGIIAYGPVLKAYGAKVYDPATNTTDIGSPQAIEAWKSMLKFYGTASGKYTATLTDPTLQFESGNVAMAIASRGALPIYRKALEKVDWDVARVPTVNGVHVSGGGSYGLSIGATSKNQAAAWAFLGWFYDPAKGLEVAQSPEGGGIIPPTAEGLDNGSWKNAGSPPNLAVFAQTAKDATLLTALPGTAGTALTDATRKAVQEVQIEGVAPEQAFKEAQDTVNAALADAKK